MLLVRCQLQSDIFEDGDDLLHVFAIGNADVDKGIAEVTIVIENAGHLTERDDVDRSVKVAQGDGANGHGLDCAAMRADLDPIADRQRILDQNEGAGDDVPDQRLGTESDGQTDHAGAGEQRADVDVQFRERDQCDHDEQYDARDVAQEREQCQQPGAAWAAGIGGAPLQSLLDDKREGLPDDEGRTGYDGDGQCSCEQGGPGFRCQPDECRKAPKLQYDQGGDQVGHSS